MSDAPFTIRDGWFEQPHDAPVWVAGNRRLWQTEEPCLIVTGDVDAARARLAPVSADTSTRAIDVATRAEREWRFGVNNDRRYLREAIVDALAAAGLLVVSGEPVYVLRGVTHAQALAALAAAKRTLPEGSAS